ncbi:hypothetical protein BGP75_00065 [Motiliproteus sp. MSK22-1]|nr:hypothetical protein BGP75_00065 [Motiliproteus sp. MSK22-1]
MTCFRRSMRTWLVTLLFGISYVNPANSASEWVYTVSDGDTLWTLSATYLNKLSYWKQLQKINGIKNPNMIKPGTRLRIPLAWIRVEPAPAVITAVIGEVRLLQSGADQYFPVAANTLLHLGDRLETGDSTTVTIRFADGTTVTVHEKSQVSLDHLNVYGDTGMVDSRLRLQQGRIDTKAKRASGPGSRFEIHTPSAISAVRGTVYRTAADNSATSRVEVIGGQVSVSAGAKRELISAGFGTVVERGKAPLQPQKLLQSPVIDAVPDKLERISWPITWQANPLAKGYRVEVSAESTFDTLLWQRASSSNRIQFPDLPDGHYFLRLRAIDQLGLEGLNAQRTIHLDAHPEPPVPLQPADGEVIRGTVPELRWTAVTGAHRYRLQVASDLRFEQLLIDDDSLDRTTLQSQDTARVGTYFWRLATIAEDGEQGPFAPFRTVVVKPVPVKPEPELSVNSDSVLASWSKGGPGQTYQVQVASNEEFDPLLQDETVSEPRIWLEREYSNLRFMRIRAIEPDGYQGPWGTRQRIYPPPDKGWLFVVVPGIFGLLF